MMTEELNENFNHLRSLARIIDSRFTDERSSDQLLRNEIAGMFAVTVSATYEGIVKRTLISYAERFHPKYKDHVERDFNRLNARISVDDLYLYSRHFGLSPWTGVGSKKNSTTFHRVLHDNRQIVERRFRVDLIASYNNIFIWRNSYAHERATTATFRDVYESHRVAQYVIRSFVKAFESG